MDDIYVKFIETKEIVKDINFFYHKIREKITLELFPIYLNDRRRKVNRNYTLIDFFSFFDKTRLLFKNDIINVFFDDENRSEIKIEKMDYDTNKLDLILNIKVGISKSEKKNKIIYEDNEIYHLLRKRINDMKEFHNSKMKDEEIGFNEELYQNLMNYKSKHEMSMVDMIIRSMDPEFKINLGKIYPIIKGIKTDRLDIIFKILHKTKFYNGYKKQISLTKFKKNFLEIDDERIIQLARCFGHTVNKNDFFKFSEDVINHYNKLIFNRLMDIDRYITKSFN